MAEVGIVVNDSVGDGDHIAELAIVTWLRLYEQHPELFEGAEDFENI